MSVRPMNVDVAVSRLKARQPAPKQNPPSSSKYADAFETGPGNAGKIKRLMTQELGKKLLDSPLFKKLPPAARHAFERVLPHLTEPGAVVALMKQLKSDWFQKLSPEEQEKNFKSLLNEVTPNTVKKTLLQQDLARFR